MQGAPFNVSPITSDSSRRNPPSSVTCHSPHAHRNYKRNTLYIEVYVETTAQPLTAFHFLSNSSRSEEWQLCLLSWRGPGVALEALPHCRRDSGILPWHHVPAGR